MKLEVVKDNKSYDLTNVIQFPISYSGSVKEFASKLTFNTAYHSVNGFPEIPLSTLKNGVFGVLLTTNENKVMFQGITKSFKSNEKNKTVECIDPAFYVIKNEIEQIQFSKVFVEDALKQLFKTINIEIEIKAESKVKIDKIFTEKTVSAVITELLNTIKKEINKDFFVKFQNNTFVFDKTKRQKFIDKEYEAQEFFITLEGQTFNVLDFMSGVSYSEDIENLKNSIKVVSSNEKNISVVDSAKDEESIKLFGLLQKVIKQEKQEQKGDKTKKTTKKSSDNKKKTGKVGKKNGKK